MYQLERQIEQRVGRRPVSLVDVSYRNIEQSKYAGVIRNRLRTKRYLQTSNRFQSSKAGGGYNIILLRTIGSSKSFNEYHRSIVEDSWLTWGFM